MLHNKRLEVYNVIDKVARYKTSWGPYFKPKTPDAKQVIIDECSAFNIPYSIIDGGILVYQDAEYSWGPVIYLKRCISKHRSSVSLRINRNLLAEIGVVTPLRYESVGSWGIHLSVPLVPTKIKSLIMMAHKLLETIDYTTYNKKKLITQNITFKNVTIERGDAYSTYVSRRLKIDRIHSSTSCLLNDTYTAILAVTGHPEIIQQLNNFSNNINSYPIEISAHPAIAIAIREIFKHKGEKGDKSKERRNNRNHKCVRIIQTDRAYD
jgi:hypothetical protein